MPQPTWQRGKCPRWCVIDHTEHDLPLDQAHRDAGTDIPATLRRKYFAGSTLTHEIAPGTITFGRWRHDADNEDWVLIGDNEGEEIEMSLNSFRRLVRALASFDDGDEACIADLIRVSNSSWA